MNEKKSLAASGLFVPDDVPGPAIEMIRAILAWPDLIAQYEGRRGTLFIDYAPGDVKIRVDKLAAEPVPSRVTLADLM